MYIVESPFAPLPTFLSGERKSLERSFGPLERTAFSAPRVFRRGDAFRKAADGFRRIAERFADLFRKFVLEALIGCSRAELVRALRRPHEDMRLGRKNCSRMAVTLLGVTAFCLRHYGFRRIGERFLRHIARPPFVSARHPFGDPPKAVPRFLHAPAPQSAGARRQPPRRRSAPRRSGA